MRKSCDVAAAATVAVDPRRRLGAGPEAWWLLDGGAEGAAENMAWDEALLEAVAGFGAPVLRFYSWRNPAATFGYFQQVAEIERITRLRPLVRRPTGGGLVPHDVDWTYSLMVPPGHGWYGLSAVESYQRMHQWVADAFARVGVAAELSACCRKEVEGQCFVGAEKFDVLWQGRKIAGAAQRRNRLGLLIQGSVQPPPVAVDRGAWQRALAAAATERWEVSWRTLVVGGELRARAAGLVAEKYAREDYNRRR